jgi:hypothetical protein
MHIGKVGFSPTYNRWLCPSLEEDFLNLNQNLPMVYVVLGMGALPSPKEISL